MNEEFSAAYKTEIKERANEILIRSRVIKGFPVICSELIKELGKEVAIEVLPFSWIEKQGMKPEEILHSNDAETFEMNGRYVIFLNQSMPDVRLRFSASHETAHIVLGHDMEVITEYRKANNPKLKALYERYEAEANYFTACLLMPEAVINRLKALGCRINKQFLQETFKVSESAAQIRLQTLNRNSMRYISYWEKEKSLDDAVLLKFAGFIQKIAPRQKSDEEEYEYEEQMQEERNRWLAEGY